jgi:hypothetical protein
MVKGKTKSGIKYQINEAIKDDARLLYMLVQIQREDVSLEKKGNVVIDMLTLIFGEEGIMPFMNAVAAAHDGVCSSEAMLAELHDILDSLNAKNS